MAMNSVIPSSVDILYRDGMELNRKVVLKPPAEGIEATIVLDPGMEVRHVANGQLVTVSHKVTPEGMKLTSEYQTRQLAGVVEFCDHLSGTNLRGGLVFQRSGATQVHFRPQERHEMLATFAFLGRTVCYVIPEESGMQVPPVISRLCPIQNLGKMDSDLRYDILDRHIRTYPGDTVPESVRVIVPDLLRLIVAVAKSSPVNSVDFESSAVSVVGWEPPKSTVNNGKKLLRRPDNSAVSRAPTRRIRPRPS